MTERAEQIYQALTEIGLSEDEINRQVNEKLTEYQGFMTKQAVLFLIAKDYGINIYSSEYNSEIQEEIEGLIDYNEFAIPISDITEGMRNIVITGRISDIFGVRNFMRKDGTPGTVGSFQICDQSECIKIIMWNEKVELMENECFQKGEIIQVIGGYAKEDRDGTLEVHLSRKGKIVLAPKGIVLLGEVKSKVVGPPKKDIIKKSSNYTIQDLHDKEGFIRIIAGTVRIEDFKELTLKNGERSFLLKLILSDDTASIRINVWDIKAVECVKTINDGDFIKLFNSILKLNKYSSEKELNFIKGSRIEIV